ncbi:unnamed protein product [Linum tenue]|uniref:Uncharacterized protein n=1 Tax=Linum tenue TaxID=586396 RepID=A0AAV0PW35_9ROSI|nr:unnamed protein product [Linum tenue]
MGLSSEQGRGCKKHPTHKEKQGICPSCLRDRLFRLNPDAPPRLSASVPSSAASASSCSSSSAPSSHDDYHDTVNNNNIDNDDDDDNKGAEKKRVGHGHHRSASSSDIGSLSFRLAPPDVTSSSGLKKCRSVAASYSFTPQPPKATRRRRSGAGGEKAMFSNYNDKDRQGGGGDFGYAGGKKKKGFWTKLLHLKGKNKEVLIHHPTMPMKGRAY